MMEGLKQIVEALNSDDDVAMRSLVGQVIFWGFCYIGAEDADHLSFEDYLARELTEYTRLNEQETIPGGGK